MTTPLIPSTSSVSLSESDGESDSNQNLLIDMNNDLAITDADTASEPVEEHYHMLQE